MQKMIWTPRESDLPPLVHNHAFALIHLIFHQNLTNMTCNALTFMDSKKKILTFLYFNQCFEALGFQANQFFHALYLALSRKCCNCLIFCHRERKFNYMLYLFQRKTCSVTNHSKLILELH
jgi:hypothetical protein